MDRYGRTIPDDEYQTKDFERAIALRARTQAIAHGLVDGTVLYTDSTHLKANANKNRYDKAVIAKSRADYWDDLDAAIAEDRGECLKLCVSDLAHAVIR
ncbi:hypothetical protein AA11237_2831 [Acidocella aminolytica 101 = DSM 11237]|nr:hypothetical protein AA11237_2831 [Acidocella aminolytica 101 = DSM 11237]